MELTNAQKTTLRNFVTNDAVLNAIPKTPDGAHELAAALNAIVPAFFVWKTFIETKDLFDGVVWTVVDSLTVGKARIFEWMIAAGSVNPSTNSVRVGITQAFGAASATEVAILGLMKRNANLIESIFANTTTGGSGNGAEATPAKVRVEGDIEVNYLRDVMGW